MLKLFRQNFKITNDCIILVTPLIIFLSILSWYINFAFNSIDDVKKLLLGIFTLFIMFSGFFASWLYMTKKTIEMSKKVYIFDKDRAGDFARLLVALPQGLGKLFIPIIGATAIYIFIYFGIYCILNFMITKYIGYVDLSAIDIDSLNLSSKELIAFVNDLDINDMKVITAWYFSSAIAINVISFITILWIPEIVYKNRNAVKALFSAVKKCFNNFKELFILYIFMLCIIKLLSIINTLLLFIPILYFFVLIITYYFIVYFVVLLFTYYEQKFTNQ